MKYQKLDDTVWIQGENLTKFIKDTNAVLKNHYDAIKLIAEKVGLTDSGQSETKIFLPIQCVSFEEDEVKNC